MNPEIAVVVPTFQRSEKLLPLLTSLGRQSLSTGRFEVIVVDDCSRDDTFELAREEVTSLPYALTVLQTPVNSGPAVARNIGWQSSTAPLIAFLDDDCIPSRRWLQAGLEAFQEQPQTGVIQGRTHIPEGSSVDRLTDWFVWRQIDGPTPYFEGANIFYRRASLEVTGGFDEEIGYHGEDCAAGWRVLEAGFRQGYCAEASVEHPIEQRGFAWHIAMGLLESRIVHCAAKHPGFRQSAFWRPWAYRREDPALLAALFGLLVGLRFRPALLLALPYLWWRRPSVRNLNFFRLCLQVPAVDAVRVAAHLRASLQFHVLVL
ncbi:MAG TPA: glycosyltransferase family 2 protein [Acidimicrobiales bacterium]|jgi:GT2 family glycosyltransferase|nr:glycosyltransferase family 2 protein [Acidimicrobiales bacterium]